MLSDLTFQETHDLTTLLLSPKRPTPTQKMQMTAPLTPRNISHLPRPRPRRRADASHNPPVPVTFRWRCCTCTCPPFPVDQTPRKKPPKLPPREKVKSPGWSLETSPTSCATSSASATTLSEFQMETGTMAVMEAETKTGCGLPLSLHPAPPSISTLTSTHFTPLAIHIGGHGLYTLLRQGYLGEKCEQCGHSACDVCSFLEVNGEHVRRVVRSWANREMNKDGEDMWREIGIWK